MDKITDPEVLTRFITDEIFTLIKQSPQSWVRRAFGSVLKVPARRFATTACTFDRYVAEYGFHEAALRILSVFARRFQASNVENIPRDGPLLITSNHPGACDSLVIAANIPRPDLKIVATGIPFIQNLKNAADHIIYCTLDAHERMIVVRSAIRHLRDGGAVLIFPTGRIDPDPALSSEAGNDLGKWSPSIELMLRHVPDTRVLLAIISGVLSPRWRRNPLVRLAGDDHKQRSFAEVMQVIQQMIFPNSIDLSPRLTFSNSLTTTDLALMGGNLLEGMIVQARSLLESHLAQGDNLLPAYIPLVEG